MLISYHNHTRWSDGQPTLAELIDGARLVGLDELGVADHYVPYPGGVQIEWTMPLDRMEEYVEAVQEAARTTHDLTIRLGVEADYFPETVDSLRALLARFSFDFVIGSVHFVDGFPIDAHGRYWEALTPEERNEKWRLYWQRVREMAESGVYDFVGHLDLPKKFGYRPTVDLTAAALDALDAIAAADMAVEINTAGWSLPAQEGYPSPFLLREARKRNIPLLINADAHSARHLTRDFDRALRLAGEAGYTELVGYEKRRRFAFLL